jgi:hypothetical protein
MINSSERIEKAEARRQSKVMAQARHTNKVVLCSKLPLSNKVV